MADRTPLARALYLVALVPPVLHLWPNDVYGLFRDELYYIACSERPALGYVDHPPLAALLLRLVRACLGDSVTAIRLLPALASGALVILCGATARRLGGGRLVQVTTGLGVALAPIYLTIFDFYSMNWIELIVWPLALHLVIVRIQEDEPRAWLVVGAVMGVGLLAKHTIVLLAAGLLVGLLLTRWRRDLLTGAFWGGVAIAFMLVLPNLVWQLRNGFPSLEFYDNAQTFKNVDTPPSTVLLMQAFVLGPGALPLWLAGLLAVFVHRELRAYRVVGWAYVVLLGVLIAAGASRPDRIAGLYPPLLAAGACWLERTACRRRIWPGILAAGLVVAGGLALLPVSVGALPARVGVAYMREMGTLLKIEDREDAQLPQWLADRVGWEQLAALVVEAYHRLPDDERARVLILVENYGQAGAIEHFGAPHGLPPVLSPHNSYFSWSAGKATTDVYLCLGFSRRRMERTFASLEVVGETDCGLCMPDENGELLYVAREPLVALVDVWDEWKSYH